MDRLLRRRPVLALAALTAACAALPQHNYAPGTPSSTVMQGMGSPSAEYKSPAGGRRLEYAGGTYGRHTYMFDFDAADRLVRADQVWTEGYFNTIQKGMSADEVLARIGKPSTTWAIAW